MRVRPCKGGRERPTGAVRESGHPLPASGDVPSRGGRAYVTLRGLILDAQLEPGRKLSEIELAERLGVDRAAVRQALEALQDEGLVAIVPQLGTFVTLISGAAVSDAIFVREALECAAVRLACRCAHPTDLGTFQGILDAQERAVRAGDYDGFGVLDDDLHHAWCVAAGCEIAWTVSRQGNGQFDRLVRLSPRQPEDLDEMLAEHRMIVSTIAQSDADAAEDALRRHLESTWSLLARLCEAHPGFFDEA